MILPTACINWAALRSGLSLPDFMASLTPEREEEILTAYNAWRKSKGLPEVRPCVSKPVAPKLTTPPKLPVAVVQPLMKGDGEPQGEDRELQDDDISSLVSKIADQVAREELEDAELIQEALRMPEKRIPREVEEELEVLVEEADTAQQAATEQQESPAAASSEAATTAPAEVAATAPSEVVATAPQPATAPSEGAAAPAEAAAVAPQAATAPTEAATTAPSEVVATAPQQSPAAAPQVEPDAPAIEADILSIARTLPKVADPALYQEILAQLDAPAEVVKSLAEETRKLYTAKHRSTVGLRTFIEWLSNNQHPL